MSGRIKSGRANRILQIAHNHPDFYPGGTEMVALALHRQALAEGWDSYFLGAVEPDQKRAHPGTDMIGLSPDGRESAIHCTGFDNFFLRQSDHLGVQRELSEYLLAIRPEIVHVHHVLNLGLEMIWTVRKTLPRARILLTFHDYYLICPYYGQMFIHETGQRCNGPSVAACAACFPERSMVDVRMRMLDVANTLTMVDRFVAPSHFMKTMMERHLPQLGEIAFVENGILAPIAAAIPSTTDRNNARYRLGYFGNLSAIKGLGDLLDAMEIITKSGDLDAELVVHGAQWFQDRAFQLRIDAARERLGDRLVLKGRYQPSELPLAMADVDAVVFPSRWWENAPLVVYEALACRRPVIAYPHGGAAEIIRRHGGGRLAAASDPARLAEAIRAEATDPSPAIDQAIPGVPEMFAAYGRLYAEA